MLFSLVKARGRRPVLYAALCPMADCFPSTAVEPSSPLNTSPLSPPSH